MINLIIKGNKKAAQRAANRHGVTVQRCRRVNGETVCQAPCRQERAVGRWFGVRGTLKPKRGYPPGTLLHYSTHRC